MSDPTTSKTVGRRRSWFRRIYGAGPAHGALMVAATLGAAYMLSRILGAKHAVWIFIWFAGAIVVHDLMLLPLYSALDRLLTARRRSSPPSASAPSWLNHVRVPAVISGTLLLITFPLVLGLSDRAYARASGLHTSVYLARWLAVTGVLFTVSAAVYGVRRARATARREP